MSLWGIEYYPKSGNKHSPADFIRDTIPRVTDQAAIMRQLANMSQHPIGDWPHTRIHKLTESIFQLTVGNYRLSYVLDHRYIVVLHCCRKRGRKTHKKDKQRAELNYKNYLSEKE